MRNKFLVLVIFGFRLIAAEKNRDWQVGQIVEIGADENRKAALADPQIHTIASGSKNFVVRGNLGNGEQAPKVGDSVRFAVEGKTMFLSFAGKETRLYVLGERVAEPKAPEASPPSPSADKPPIAASDALDNDAIVKMIVGGLKPDTVVQVIQARPGKYSLGPEAIAALTAVGVPQSVIAAMTAKMSSSR